MATKAQEPQGTDVHYTTFIRVPRPRGEFVDPPLIDWHVEKDQDLWKILSRSARSSDLNWKDLAARFNVPLPFILQQAAWLYERQLSQVRDQMRKVGKGDGNESDRSAGASPQLRIRVSEHRKEDGIFDGTASGRHQRQASLDKAAQSSFSVRDDGSTSTGKRRSAPPISRTTSSNTVTQSRHPSSPRLQHIRTSSNAKRDSVKGPESPNSRPESISEAKEQRSRSTSGAIESSSSSSDSESETNKPKPARPQPLRRPSRFSAVNRPSFSRRAPENEEEEVPAFLPFAKPVREEHQSRDAANELPENSPPQPARAQSTTKPEQVEYSSPNSSSASVASPISPAEVMKPARPRATLSPSRKAQLATAKGRKKVDSKTGGKDTPSMGSSFSDLDSTSVTQSALEDALLSNMQHTDLSSRTSTNSHGETSQSRRQRTL